jgi:2-C-methyl-D-erythritol 2,4-cyclodiphosphate synthase
MDDIRTGFGYDIHRLEAGTEILLGGVRIPSAVATIAHSDGDIVCHALAQAILASLGLDDIGTYFPDTAKDTAKMDSTQIVRRALTEMTNKDYCLSNVSLAIVTETPKLMPYKHAIRDSLAKLLSLDSSRIAVHANTSEGVGPVGKKEAIEVYASVLVYHKEK